MTAALYARIVGFALCWLLALATSASAECAWVLWAAPFNSDGTYQRDKWDPVNAFSTREDCVRWNAELGTAGGDGWHWRRMCLPDTVDPRGPKGTK